MSDLNPCRDCGFEPRRLPPVGDRFSVVCDCGNTEIFIQAPSALYGLVGFSQAEKEVTDRWNRRNPARLAAATNVVVTLPEPNGHVPGSTVTIQYGEQSLSFRCRRQKKSGGEFHNIWEIEPGMEIPRDSKVSVPDKR